MANITIETDISRPPAEVFDYGITPAHFPEWQRDVVRAELVSGDDAAEVGARFTTTRIIAGREQTLTQEVTASDRPRTWTARGIDGPLRPIATLMLTPSADGQATHVRFEIDYNARGLARAILPLVIRQTEKGAPASFRRLKDILESRLKS